MAFCLSLTTAPGSLVISPPSASAPSSTSRMSLAMKASFKMLMLSFRSAASIMSITG